MSNADKPYPFAERKYLIEMTAQAADPDKPGSKPKVVKHRLLRPTYERLDVWEKAQAYTTKAVNPREKEILTETSLATAA